MGFNTLGMILQNCMLIKVQTSETSDRFFYVLAVFKTSHKECSKTQAAIDFHPTPSLFAYTLFYLEKFYTRQRVSEFSKIIACLKLNVCSVDKQNKIVKVHTQLPAHILKLFFKIRACLIITEIFFFLKGFRVFMS